MTLKCVFLDNQTNSQCTRAGLYKFESKACCVVHYKHFTGEMPKTKKQTAFKTVTQKDNDNDDPPSPSRSISPQPAAKRVRIVEPRERRLEVNEVIDLIKTRTRLHTPKISIIDLLVSLLVYHASTDTPVFSKRIEPLDLLHPEERDQVIEQLIDYYKGVFDLSDS